MNQPMTHAEATELAGLYVLDALVAAERAQVDAHLANCAQAHDDFAAVGGVVPALASLADPVGAPASLKNKVLADYRAGAYAGAHSPAARVRPARQSWLGWAAAAAAVLLLAVTAGWAVTAQSHADAQAQRAQQLAQAINILSSPRSQSATLHGAAQADGARGFAAIDRSGAGYMVLLNLPAAPAGQAYQAWYLTDHQPTSAGLLSVQEGGFAVLSLSSPTPFDQVALTLEPAAGSAQPTSDPILTGELTTHA
ncbi:MAG: anti-sigma factor [Chloroflexota bacterium]